MKSLLLAAWALMFLGGNVCPTGVATILLDYSDGGGDGLHDTAVRDGDFENAIDGALNDQRTYADMPNWDNLGGSDTATASRTNLAPLGQGPRNVIMSTSRHPAQNTGYSIQLGDEFQGAMMWRDANSWDPDDEVQMILFHTSDGTLGGAVTDLVAWNTGPRVTLETWEPVVFPATEVTDTNAVGKELMVRFEVAGDPSHFARIDNVYLQVVSQAEPPPVSALLLTNLVASSGTVTVEWNLPADKFIVAASEVLNGIPTHGLTVASGTTPAHSATFPYVGSAGFFQVATNISVVSNIVTAGLIAAVKEQSSTLAPSNRVYGLETASIIGLGLPGETVGAGELSDFINLKSLSLANASLTGMGSLSSLSNLVWLNLSSNQFTSGSLPDLPSGVEALNLEQNQITMLKMIEPLVHLRWLDIESNSVTDLSSIVNNAAAGGLGDGDQLWVRGNPLSSAATNQIQILQSTYNVNVIYE